MGCSSALPEARVGPLGHNRTSIVLWRLAHANVARLIYWEDRT